jgi:Lipid A 3-O-deacylase (PagL)
VLGSPSRTRTLPGPRSLWRYSYFDMIKRKLWLLPLALAWHTTPALLIGQNSAASPLEEVLAVPPQPIDFNKNIYYRNKLEFSLETGALPINIPFVFDIFVGGDYSQRPLHYTLVPIFPSLRWQMGDIKGPGILRGNTDLTATISVTAIPKGPEKIYGAFDLGVRRNFVHRNWRTVPYFEFRLGAGFIDAKEPDGVSYAQGQDFTFTLMMGAGARYNFNPRYSMSFGPEYMHVSNLYLSEQHLCPTAAVLHPCYNNGINVWGGMVGFNVRLGKPKETVH